MRWRQGLLVAGIFVAMVVLGFGVAFWGGGRSSPAALRPAPNFVLKDQRGRRTSLAQFRGQAVALAFLDPECTQICPLTSQILLQAIRRLGPAGAQVELLGINANPQATSVADVAAYSRIHGMDALGPRWRFLTGSPAQLRRVWKAFGVYVATEQGEDVHQAAVLLIGERGDERDTYVTPMRYDSVPRQAAILAAKIAQLLPGDPAMRPPPGPQYPPAWPPARLETVAAIAPRAGGPDARVALGTGHPHLVCFFADWQRLRTNLPAHLAALDAYRAAARRHGWPLPVAIDEMPTEPSPVAARRGLRQLAMRLRTPVVSDQTGRIADGYGVNDLPWYALTSSRGRIVWQHDGWLRAPALIHQAGAAWALERRQLTRGVVASR